MAIEDYLVKTADGKKYLVQYTGAKWLITIDNKRHFVRNFSMQKGDGRLNLNKATFKIGRYINIESSNKKGISISLEKIVGIWKRVPFAGVFAKWQRIK